MNKNIAVLPGDGIGPEVIQQAIKSLRSVEQKFGHQFELKEYPIGAAAMDLRLPPLPDDTLSGCNQADAVLFGAIGDPKYDVNPHAEIRPEQGLLRLRKELGLYANIRPIKSYRKLQALSPLKEEQIQNVNLVIFRELTGGFISVKNKKMKQVDGPVMNVITT